MAESCGHPCAGRRRHPGCVCPGRTLDALTHPRQLGGRRLRSTSGLDTGWQRPLRHRLRLGHLGIPPMPAGAARPALGRQATWLPFGLKLNLQVSRVDSIRYSSCLAKSRQSNPHNSAPNGTASPHSSGVEGDALAHQGDLRGRSSMWSASCRLKPKNAAPRGPKHLRIGLGLRRAPTSLAPSPWSPHRCPETRARGRAGPEGTEATHSAEPPSRVDAIGAGV